MARFSGDVAKSTAKGMRILLSSGLPLVVLLHYDADEAGADPIGLLRIQARPGKPTQPLHLVFLDRKRDLARAWIAADLADFGAGRVIEHGRIVTRRRPRLARPNQELVGERVLEGLDRPIRAPNADVVINGGRAEMDKLGCVMAKFTVTAELHVEQGISNCAVLWRTDDRTVAWRHVIDMPERSVTCSARHVCNDHVGMPGNVFAPMAGKQACIDIEAAARRRANDDCDLSAFVELSNGILGKRRATTQQRRQQNENSLHLSSRSQYAR